MRIRTPRDIGVLIKEARTRQGMSQAAFAKRINSTQTWVSWVENGKPTAEIGSVLLALTTLGVGMEFHLPPSSSITPSDVDHGDDDRGDDDDTPPYKL